MGLDLEPYQNWMGGERPYYIFGPCSAESPEQLNETAAGIKRNFEHIIFRAGIWKPRTRPNTFEGVGVEALEWLGSVKRELGFKITTEVADEKHVEACLKAGVDMLWIGARTTANPFSIQAIAEALKGVDIPVFVKNPIHPDLSLWIGGLERINKAGVKKLGAIHRGFHMEGNGPYRNSPNWNLAIQLKALNPDLPLLCDVSHIAGKPELIPYVAQKAIDLDMDGLMIETHIQPGQALSDKEQQVTPENLAKIIGGITHKSKTSSNQEYKSQLEVLRDQMDEIDDELIELIAKRMSLAKRIGEYKYKNQVTVLQVNRWKEIVNRILSNGKALGLGEKFILDMLNSLHDESIRQQTLIHKKNEDI